jgi:hypothetical protein
MATETFARRIRVLSSAIEKLGSIRVFGIRKKAKIEIKFDILNNW